MLLELTLLRSMCPPYHAPARAKIRRSRSGLAPDLALGRNKIWNEVSECNLDDLRACQRRAKQHIIMVDQIKQSADDQRYPQGERYSRSLTASRKLAAASHLSASRTMPSSSVPTSRSALIEGADPWATGLRYET